MLPFYYSFQRNTNIGSETLPWEELGIQSIMVLDLLEVHLDQVMMQLYYNFSYQQTFIC